MLLSKFLKFGKSYENNWFQDETDFQYTEMANVRKTLEND